MIPLCGLEELKTLDFGKQHSGQRVCTSLEGSFIWAFHRRVNVKERRTGSMSWIEIISMLVGIPASVITILTASKNYIKSKKDSKKDPSASLAASDGSDDNLAK